MSTSIFEDSKILFEAVFEESSEEPPMSDWSSLDIKVVEENEKKILQEQGLYDPGSGEICTKYIAMSASSVLAHPYFNYPVLLDPGIQEALLKPELKKVYRTDGQQKYLEICEEMDQCVVKSFYNGLLTDSINLKYYSVNPYGVRPMSMALSFNTNVTSLDFSDNFLNDDACFHLGKMLTINYILKKLNLTGCRIGASGARLLFAGLPLNSSLKTLNLSKNQLGNLGIEYFATAVEHGIEVQKIILSYNNISGQSAHVLAKAFVVNNKFTHLDLSWNNLFDSILGTVTLLSRLADNPYLIDLNLSWNALRGGRIGTAISTTLKAANLKFLNLSNNKLGRDAISNIIKKLETATKLITLNLSFNPMTPNDASAVLQKIKFKSVILQNLIMDNVFVDSEFIRLLNDIKDMKSKANLQVQYGGVVGEFKPVGPDMRDIVLDQVEFLTTKNKRRSMDIALFAMDLLKNNFKKMDSKSFAAAVAKTGAPLNKDLIDEIIETFPGPKIGNSNSINLNLLVEYVQRKWPDRKLPPTPPPEPEPDPQLKPKPKKSIKPKKNKKKRN